ncbi:MAG: cysteine--tRNA ligase [Verrucomicrobiota bacterium]
MKLFNTLTRQLDEIELIRPPEVSLYACGPTVYDFAHIGNFRTFVFVDLLRRSLKFLGYQVKHAMNYTDVDDKTIRGAQKAGQSLRDYTTRYIECFLEDCKSLNLETPEFLVRATDHIPQMIALIQKLIDQGYAYVSEDGSVYFRVNVFKNYGCLACLDRAGLKAGARVNQDEYQKESFGDFALWKSWTPEDAEVKWDSPWGPGRPGWHIECSAMSMEYLGDTFDIHCGGVDLVFPHHENEIAQSEAASGKKFVNYWAHAAHLLVNDQKMSKSLGNFFTLRDLLEKGYEGRVIRYTLFATAHYRQTLNFTWESLDASKAAISRLDDWISRFTSYSVQGEWSHDGVLEKFKSALNEDLNISEAMASLFDFVRETNKRMDEGLPVGNLPLLWSQMNSVLGIAGASSEIPAQISTLVNQRQEARKNKDWAGSDRLRDEMSALGWIVRDTSKGQEVKKR